MSDNFIRHFVAFVGTLLVAGVYLAGYVAGGEGWRWGVLTALLAYPIIFGIIKAV